MKRQQQQKRQSPQVSTLKVVENDDTVSGTGTTIGMHTEVDNPSIEDHFFDSAIINHKLQGLQLSDQKLFVLQDAAKRVVERHREHLQHVQRQHTATIATSVETIKQQNQVEIEKLNHTMERRLQQMEAERNKVINELHRTKKEYKVLVESERNTNRRIVEDWNTKYNEDHQKWIEAERRVRDKLLLMERNATIEVEEARRTIHQLQFELEKQRMTYQALKNEYETQQQQYQTEMEDLRKGIEQLQAERTSIQKDIIQQKEQFHEQMEIAEAAVIAATNREQELYIQLHTMEVLQHTNQQLEDQVSELNEQLQQLLVEQSTAVVAKNNRSIISSTLRQRIYQYLWPKNDPSILRIVSRWIQSVFVPTIFPFVPIRRRRVHK